MFGLLRSAFKNPGGTERRKNAHRIISDKQNGILLPSRFAAIRLSAIRQTISRKPGLIPCRWLAPCKRLSLRLYRSALTAVSLALYRAAALRKHFCFCRQNRLYLFRRKMMLAYHLLPANEKAASLLCYFFDINHTIRINFGVLVMFSEFSLLRHNLIDYLRTRNGKVLVN